MRKFLIFLIGIFGFALIFSVSGLIAYYMFPEDGSEPIEHELQGAMVPIGGGAKPAAPELNPAMSSAGQLTIVTPALDKTKTVVRKGTIDDAVPHKEPVMPVMENESEYSDEDEMNNGPQQSNAEDKPKNNQSEENDETPPKTEQPKPHEPENEENPQEPEKPQINNNEKPNLNPDVQISDDGL